MNPLLSIRNLTVTVGAKTILDHIDLDVARGHVCAIVGESGSGKTSLGLAILRLLPEAMRITAGHILFENDDLLQLSDELMHQVRGAEIGFVFQEPLTAFDPLYTIGYQLDETLKIHTGSSDKERNEHIHAMLRLVEIDDPARIYHSYPHQLSGGLCQRAMIAQSIICQPPLIIADEATSSLDVVTQAKLISLLRKLNKEKAMSMIIITHDLGMALSIADEIVVMKEGSIVERAQAQEIMHRPKHPYTKALIEAY